MNTKPTHLIAGLLAAVALSAPLSATLSMLTNGPADQVRGNRKLMVETTGQACGNQNFGVKNGVLPMLGMG